VTTRVGTSGWVYKDWKGRFYPTDVPQSEWLSYYATEFDTVEINATFYRLARANVVERWAASVPSDFRFAVKGSRYITHMLRLRNTSGALRRFFEPLEALLPVTCTVLWQLPPTMKLDLDRLRGFLDELPAEPVPAIEFRHPSWQTDEALALLDERGAMLVAVSGPQLPMSTAVVSGGAYVRFHGLRPGYGYDYTERDLRPWVEHVARQPEALAYFNNDAKGHAVENARTFRRLLGAAHD
jgi:uncharacterized protein YecE (DUF72 family)